MMGLDEDSSDSGHWNALGADDVEWEGKSETEVDIWFSLARDRYVLAFT
jgi:hypothetical protein